MRDDALQAHQRSGPARGPARDHARGTVMGWSDLASGAVDRTHRRLVLSVTISPMVGPIDNGKPVARRGRKATDLTTMKSNKRKRGCQGQGAKKRICGSAGLSLISRER